MPIGIDIEYEVTSTLGDDYIFAILWYEEAASFEVEQRQWSLYLQGNSDMLYDGNSNLKSNAFLVSWYIDEFKNTQTLTYRLTNQ